MQKNYLQIDPRDNVIVAITNLEKGLSAKIGKQKVVLKEDIKQKHKFALNDFEVDDEIFMYGLLIGKAIQPIKAGSAITIFNLKHSSAEYSIKNKNYNWVAPDISKFDGRTFDGYHRADGKVGTANFWLVIPLTFCENRNLDVIEAALSEKLGYETARDFAVHTDALIEQYKAGATLDEILNTPIINTAEEIFKNRLFPNLDGIKFLKHDGGCGGTRQDAEVLCKLLAGYITNPNVAGATILSLGCQNAQVEMMQKALNNFDPNFKKPVYILEQQKIDSERKLIEEAVKRTFLGLIEANKIVRKPAPLSKLVLGLECG